MRNVLLIIAMTMIRCSSSDDGDQYANCNCQTILFRATKNKAEGTYYDYLGTDCLAYWEGNKVNVTVDKSTNPVTVYGPSKEQVEIGKDKSGRCK